MSEGVLTPPASPGVEASSSRDLRQTLDGFLERYLYLIAEQQKLQEELGKHMSAGFFSLARANHSCPPGRRYGEDYYDERMKATRTVCVTADKSPDPRPEATEPVNNTENKEVKRIQGEMEPDEIKTSLFRILRPSTPETNQITKTTSADVEHANDDPTDAEPEENAKETASKPSQQRPTDPLRWFGILVPPPLRSAQGSFISAVEGPVGALASVIAEMRVVEAKVDELRGTIEEEGK